MKFENPKEQKLWEQFNDWLVEEYPEDELMYLNKHTIGYLWRKFKEDRL